MPKSFFLLASTTVPAGGQSTVTFSNINQSYKNLLVMYSARTTNANVYETFKVRFNGSSSNVYDDSNWFSTGTTPTSSRNQPVDSFSYELACGSSATANNFSNGQIVISNYVNSSIGKTAYWQSSAEPGAISWGGKDFRTAGAINSISFITNSGNFAQNSIFTLYAQL